MVRRLLAALAPALLVAACGSGGHTTSSTTTTSSTRSTKSSAAATQTTATTAPAARSATTSTTTSSTTSTHTVASHTHTHQPESTPHFLVKFRVGAGGTLTPPSVAIGGHATVYLSVSNASGGPLKLALRHGDKTVFTRTLPTGASTTKLPSLGNATYAVVLDGTPRGTLTIGAKAGP